MHKIRFLCLVTHLCLGFVCLAQADEIHSQQAWLKPVDEGRRIAGIDLLAGVDDREVLEGLDASARRGDGDEEARHGDSWLGGWDTPADLSARTANWMQHDELSDEELNSH